MSVISHIRDEKGGTLLVIMFFIIFMGAMGASLVTLVVSNARTENIHADELRAFYAAQSGLEYGIRRIMESDVTSLFDWTENVDAGDGLHTIVTANFLSGHRVRIQATGYSTRITRRIQRTINYIDVSEYAVYASGSVEYTVTKEWPNLFGSNDPSLVYQNAPVMPIFELDELRNLAKPSSYFDGNLVVDNLFNFSPRRITFVEGDLSFVSWNWFNFGNFVSMGDVLFDSAWLPFTTSFGTVYQPVPGKRFVSNRSFFNRSFIGGIISNGDVIGSSNGATAPFWGKLYVFHHRSTILDLMSHSLNGGPLLILNNRWENLN